MYVIGYQGFKPDEALLKADPVIHQGAQAGHDGNVDLFCNLQIPSRVGMKAYGEDQVLCCLWLGSSISSYGKPKKDR